MRDTEPFTPARVQVKMLALPVYPEVLTTLHWSPEVKCVQSSTNIDESDVAPSMQSFSSHTGVRRHRVNFQLANGEAGEFRVVGRLKADCTSCLTRGANR